MGRSKIADLATSFVQASSGVENVRATVSALELQLKARTIEWDSFSESMRDRVGALQAGMAENKWGMVTIAGAISTIAKPEIASPSRHSMDSDSRYILDNSM